MGNINRLIAVLVTFHGIAAAAVAGERATEYVDRVVSGKFRPTAKNVGLKPLPIDRVVSAVDAAESSHGQDMAMWRSDPAGPQGPMQVPDHKGRCRFRTTRADAGY
jgi:hypothetical protein